MVYCRACAAKGSKVTCVEDGLPTWVAEVRFPAVTVLFLADMETWIVLLFLYDMSLDIGCQQGIFAAVCC